MSDNPRASYVFDNSGEQAPARFSLLESMYDEHTQRHIEARGIAPGWSCLDVGGGSGSVARWLSERVGATGRVLVTDIDTRFIEELSGGNISVLQHDIGADDLEPGAFDLIHTRLVLVHVPERVRAVHRMARALKPGGWIVAEEFDAQSLPPNPTRFGEPYLKSIQALSRAMVLRGVDNEFGRRLPSVMRDAGLHDVGAEARLLLFCGGSPGAQMTRANLDQLRDDLLATGLVDEDELAADVRRLDDPNVRWPSQIMWSVWGRKPA